MNTEETQPLSKPPIGYFWGEFTKPAARFRFRSRHRDRFGKGTKINIMSVRLNFARTTQMTLQRLVNVTRKMMLSVFGLEAFGV